MRKVRQGLPGIVLPALLALCLGACAALPSAQVRRGQAEALAHARSWQVMELAAAPFTLVSFVPANFAPQEVLTVYLEGDGLAWIDGKPSSDPSPRNPLALRLALAQASGNAAYLARPCQYVGAGRSGCAQRYWTNARNAPEVVGAMNAALDLLKQRFGARQLVLVGYSGGGALAILLAAERRDVARIVTVAANLDHRTWTAHHGLKPLDQSLNAADVASRVAQIPQVHWIGGRDWIVPEQLARGWPQALAGPQGANLKVVPDFTHACCWAEQWPHLTDGQLGNHP